MRRAVLASLAFVGVVSAQCAFAQWRPPRDESSAARGTGIVRCASSDGRQRECAADVRRGARLLRQLSHAPCTEGETWGIAPGGIWVTRGCRGIFSVRGGGDGDERQAVRTLRCESGNGEVEQCPAPTHGGVRLLRQLSRGPCIAGSTWGYDRHGIWVAQGCRAVFALSDGDTDEPGREQVVRCESADGRRRRCSVPLDGGAELARQLSRAPCVRGQTWGWDAQGLWVDAGCRADFRIW